MKVAFILMTAACLTGQTPPPPGPGPGPGPGAAPAPMIGAGCGGSCSGGCGCETGCDSGCGGGFLHKLHNRLGGGGGLFHRNNDCGCDSCGSSGHGHAHRTSCNSCTQSYNSCNSCECGGGQSFGGRLRGLFHHRNNSSCGCDTCGSCNSCGSVGGAYPGVITTPPGGKIGEPIAPPQGKPLPPGDKNKDKGKTTFDGVNVEPPTTNVVTPATPEAGNGQGLDVVPPTVVPSIPAVPGKSPF